MNGTLFAFIIHCYIFVGRTQYIAMSRFGYQKSISQIIHIYVVLADSYLEVFFDL